MLNKDNNCRYVLERITAEFKSILSDNLTGIYLHGSLAFGCFRNQTSDIDFIAVVNKPLEIETKIRLIESILSLDAYAPKKGMEMSVVLRAHCRTFIYPTPFELHYSPLYADECRKDMAAYCNRMHGVDKDLASHFSVINSVGITLCGEDKDLVFAKVPHEYYLDSIKEDISGAEDKIQSEPVYYTLNLCRVLAYITTGRIMSKADGGRWGENFLPARFKSVIRAALNTYSRSLPYCVSMEKTAEFARYMVREIAKY